MGRGARHPPSLVRPISLLKGAAPRSPSQWSVPGRNDFRVLIQGLLGWCKADVKTNPFTVETSSIAGACLWKKMIVSCERNRLAGPRASAAPI
jgi:hypothetical protein